MVSAQILFGLAADGGLRPEVALAVALLAAAFAFDLVWVLLGLAGVRSAAAVVAAVALVAAALAAAAVFSAAIAWAAVFPDLSPAAGCGFSGVSSVWPCDGVSWRGHCPDWTCPNETSRAPCSNGDRSASWSPLVRGAPLVSFWVFSLMSDLPSSSFLEPFASLPAGALPLPSAVSSRWTSWCGRHTPSLVFPHSLSVSHC